MAEFDNRLVTKGATTDDANRLLHYMYFSLFLGFGFLFFLLLSLHALLLLLPKTGVHSPSSYVFDDSTDRYRLVRYLVETQKVFVVEFLRFLDRVAEPSCEHLVWVLLVISGTILPSLVCQVQQQPLPCFLDMRNELLLCDVWYFIFH